MRKNLSNILIRFLLLLLLCGLSAGCRTPAGETAEVPSETQPPVETPLPNDQTDDTVVPDTVEINGRVYPRNASSVALSVGSVQELEEALAAFPALESVMLEAPALSPEEILAVRERHPDLRFSCSVALNGQAIPMSSEALDLSAIEEKDLPDVISLFPALQTLTLGEVSPLLAEQILDSRPDLDLTYRFRGQIVSRGTDAFDLTAAPMPTAAELDALYKTAPLIRDIRIGNPTETDLGELLAFCPREKGITVHGTLTVLDRTFDADAELIDFGDRKMTDEEALQIAAMIPLMTNLKEIDLYESRLGQETMDALFDGYPDIFFGWTFTMWDGFYTVRSDVSAFSSMIGLPGTHNGLLTEDDFRNLRYCKNLQALDLGHNGIKNLEFLRNWPHMKILILADTRVTDLSVIAELQELEYLELFLTTPDSYEPLTHLPNLLDLNLGHTKKAGKQYRDDDEIRLLTQIKSLERLWINKTLTTEQAQILREGLPGVEFDFSSYGSTDKGWRTHPRFFIMRRGFREGRYIPFE